MMIFPSLMYDTGDLPNPLDQFSLADDFPGSFRNLDGHPKSPLTFFYTKEENHLFL
jgi:hypothetical protein